ncbi:hypothetical protein BKA70DRAFT_1375313 [Coprinopsis sp. MPI-PUGE-AT-0042]|nr:hypothetical protein BKA70DRAFT_1375313 [Coprinopsis sp. MPI-PUGE-AT-0042]
MSTASMAILHEGSQHEIQGDESEWVDSESDTDNTPLPMPRRRGRLATGEARRREKERSQQKTKKETILLYLKKLKNRGIRFGDIMELVFDPTMGQGNIRWHEFLVFPGEVERVLNWWVSYQRGKTREAVHEWAIAYVEGLMAKEAARITDQGILRSSKKTVNPAAMGEFGIGNYHDDLKSLHAPVAMRILKALSSSRAAAKHTAKRRKRTELVTTIALLSLLGEYSHGNNWVKWFMSLYLYISGAPRQTISVLSVFGLSESYTSLTSKRLRRLCLTKKNAQEAPTVVLSEAEKQAGTINQLQMSVREEARELAATGLFGEVLDNLNFRFDVAEQTIGSHDTQENGTCTTIWKLHDASLEDLDGDCFRKAFLEAPALQLEDVCLTPEEQEIVNRLMVHTILRIIVTHGGEHNGQDFSRYSQALESDGVETSEKIPVHKTKLLPLPARPIDQASVQGNIDVDRALVDELQLEKVPRFYDRVRPKGGDQLTMARYRSIGGIRAGHADGYEAFDTEAHILGLFHTKIADTQGTLLNHWGKPDSGDRNPGSLWFHNTHLDRLPITTTSLPSFHVCRDLIFTSLYARILHCLLLVSKCSSLEDYLSSNFDYSTVKSHAQQIHARYASAAVGDTVFENAILFNRDALISRAFTDVIKASDSGLIILILKLFAAGFRGNGHTKYAYEMLINLHNLQTVYPEPIRRIIKSNWVLNPTGNPNSGVEVDLAQEHINLLIKRDCKAHAQGNATWDWLTRLSPCTIALRDLSNSFHELFGSDQGTKHAQAKLQDDIQSLVDSLSEHHVYDLRKGRTVDDDDKPVIDVVTVGVMELSQSRGSKGPIAEYNAWFRDLQRHRQMKTVGQVSAEHASATAALAEIPSSPPSEGFMEQADLNPPLGDPGEETAIGMPVGHELADIMAEIDAGEAVDDSLPRVSLLDVDFGGDVILVSDSDPNESGDDSDSDLEYVDT